MLFVYLARRDKRAVKLLAIGQGELSAPVHLDEAMRAGLDPAWREALAPHADPHRMSCELVMESAESFTELTARLRRRGYRVDPFQTPVAWVRSAEPCPGHGFCPGERAAHVAPEVLKRLELGLRRRRTGG
jgi:hypothetical protein